MKKKMSLALILVFILTFSAITFAENTQNQFAQTHVLVDIKLKSPDLAPPAVQFAIFFKDPVASFKHVLANQSGQNKDPRIASLIGWNRIFQEITGDCLYLLTMEPVTYSTDFTGKIWLVTKMVYIAKRPVCWCIPLNVKNGQEYQVVLSKDNRIDLEDFYNKLTKK